MKSPVIQVECLKHVYPDQTVVSICGLDFVVNEGERVVILGPNGSGKTTLISHILGLLKPIEGKVAVMGLDPVKHFGALRSKVGVVFQNVDEQIIGPRVYDDIAFTLRNLNMPKTEIDQRVQEVAVMLNITHLLDRVPHYLSGGEKKKVALAGALALMPQILILDEPFNSLDPESKKELVSLINHLNSHHGLSVLITTHDMDLVPMIADVVYVLNKGHIVTKGKPHTVFSQTQILKDAYLEPPILIELFTRLKAYGYVGHIPYDMEEAMNLLICWLDLEKKPQEGQ
jgi:cobalt/nickel transport system ATP-binding protein